MADAILWHALEVDPNQDDALGWYAASANERAGKEGMIQAWKRVAELPGTWRLQLWLARTALESGDLVQALTRYREILSLVGRQVPADLLMQMRGDLGVHNHFAHVIELCEPLFDPETHGLPSGNNIVRARVPKRPVWGAKDTESIAGVSTARLGTTHQLLGRRDRQASSMTGEVSPLLK